MRRPLVSIIIATLNTPRLTQACLNTVVKNTTVPYELIVVNNSRARPIRKCLKKFKGIRIIQNPKNMGYAKAANQGLVAARGQYLCLLNTDTLVPPHWLERLLEAIQKPGVAAVGPASDELYQLHGRSEGKRWPFPFLPNSEANTARADELLRRRHWNRLESVRFLHGFCLLFSRVAMAGVGRLDEGCFFGLEDIDYSLRLRLHGYRLLRVHSLFVHHRQGASSQPERRRRLVEQAGVHFIQKWTTPMDRPGIDLLTLLRDLNRRILLQKKLPEVGIPIFPNPLIRAAPRRLVRQGFRVQSHIRCAMVRFSDLDIFGVSSQVSQAWSSLRGGMDLSGPWRKRSSLLGQQVEGLVRLNLVRSIQPSKPARCLVTVMMAARQAEHWIDQAIESVLAQKFRDFELIIVDDGSLDGTPCVIQQYAWHPQIRLLFNPLQQGIPATRNRILREARGKYVAICDADDLMLPNFLARFVRVLEQNPRTAWVYSDRMGIRFSGSQIKTYPARPPDGKMELRSNVIAHAGALIRREAMEAVGGYDETYLSTEDYDLALKIARKWKVLALPGEMHYLWRQHQQSLSQTNPWARQETDQIRKLAR